MLPDVGPEPGVICRPVQSVADQAHQAALLVTEVVPQDLVSQTVDVDLGQGQRASLTLSLLLNRGLIMRLNHLLDLLHGL